MTKQLLSDDCFRTCIAFILQVEPALVPHFYENNNDDGQALAEVWLKDRGYALLKLSLPAAYTLEKVLETANHITSETFPYIVSGQTLRGTDHAVVGFKKQLILDPYTGYEPTAELFKGPCSNGIWGLEIIVRKL